HLEEAWKTKQLVIIQCKERNVLGEAYLFQATVEGFSDNLVFLLRDEQLQPILIEQLLAVQPIEKGKWFQ
ncbi:hypothetical protein ACFJYO_16630, partial [Enterococcus faecalis]